MNGYTPALYAPSGSVGVLDSAISTGQDASWRWDRMMLTAPAGTRAVACRDVPAELRPVLRLFDTASAGTLNGGPSVPSAGALHPYEYFAAVGEAIYALDAARHRCTLVRSGAAVRTALEQAGLADTDAAVLVVLRPWLSMRKYGDRGYLYAQLDAAHLATHLLVLATESHDRAELRTTPSGSLGELLSLDANCRYVHSVLALRGAHHDTHPHEWSFVDERGAAVAGDRFWLEQECWKSLAGLRGDTPGPAASVRRGPLLPEMRAQPETDPFPGPESMTSLAAKRRSAKDFAPAVLTCDEIDRTLAALRTPLLTDLPPDSGLGLTLVVREVADCAPGSYPLYGPGRMSDPAAVAPSGDELVRVCMGQEHLRHASAVLLCHTDRQRLLDAGPRGVSDALFRAGALTHLLYLGAAATGVDVTAIGGFDSMGWRVLAGLPDGHEVLYVALLGRSGRTSVKLDRLHRAYAHNER
ncbi:hypothetical protein Lesp02_14920 [Lentzea sp. NBRC 105346]|uniref:nitroreductase family protein n=1 Tax=Lentzea sp. NBRC 105346 TaxID=3032205 RepID=UPI0024A5EA63|nr:nitroreductase family protein [Lentzea sp. NBRC 105346]GLZ29302.1 hypothetical protein Lesp02_14920 [Lentzea sp. NBRC 105346]